MIAESILKEIVTSQKSLFLNKQDLFERTLLKTVVKRYGRLKEIVVITGLRRVGKSSLMKLVWDEFKKEEQLSDDQCLYFNCEDERLVSFSPEDFSKIIEIYYQLYSPNVHKRIFLFLDEIQNIPYWEKWLRRLYEENKFKIFVTGSNSSLLSSEFSVALTGRHLSATLYPLSFYEFYVYFQKNTINQKSFYTLEEKVRMKKSFSQYVKLGGMPEYLKTKSSELIQEYFKDILLRDIVNRYRIKYRQGLKELAHFLLCNPGQVFSLLNLSKSIVVKNLNTVKNYLQYLEESFLFFRMPLFSYSYRQQVYNPHKVYLADMAFFNQLAFKTSVNYGAMYENLVFLTLKRCNQEIFYYKTKDNTEVDFVMKDKHRPMSCIQVSYSLHSQQTKDREIKALTQALQELNVPEGLILTHEEEDVITCGKRRIIIKSLYRWLLEKEL